MCRAEEERYSRHVVQGILELRAPLHFVYAPQRDPESLLPSTYQVSHVHQVAQRCIELTGVRIELRHPRRLVRCHVGRGFALRQVVEHPQYPVLILVELALCSHACLPIVAIVLRISYTRATAAHPLSSVGVRGGRR